MPKVSPLQDNFNGGELSPLSQGRVSTDRYRESLQTCENYLPTLQGGLIRRPGTYFAGRARMPRPSSGPGAPNMNVRLIPFQFSTTQAYVLEFSHTAIRFYKDNAPILEAAKTITGATRANPCEITIASHGYSTGDDVEINGVAGMTELNGKRFEISATGANTFTLYGVNSTSYGTYTSGGTSERVYTVTSPYNSDDLWELDYEQSADIIYVTHPSYRPRYLSRTGHTSWLVSQFSNFDGPYLPLNTTSTTMVSSGASGSVTITASSATFNSSTDISRNLRLKSGSDWAYLIITAVTSNTIASATVIVGSAPVVATTNWRLGFWTATNYPAVVCFHEDRLCFGGAPNSPQRFDLSVSSDYANFAPSELTGGVVTASNAISYTLSAGNVNNIRWLVSDEKGLLSGSVGNEWVVKPSSQAEALSPTNVNARPASSYGSAAVKPVKAGKATIFVQNSGRKIREFTYFYEVDGFRAPDVSVLAEHVTQSGIVQMAMQKEPQPIIWCVRADGVLATLTYEREQDALRAGWSRQILGGVSDAAGSDAKAESVCVIPSPDGTREEPWIVVNRHINGSMVKQVEYVTQFFDADLEQVDAFFVDCGLTYDNPLTIDPTAAPTVITKANPASVYILGHGLATGDKIRIDDVVGMEELNGEVFTVTVTNGNEFTLGVNSTSYGTYVSGGYVRELVSTVSGLHHLEGQTVQILGDGAVQPDKTVTNGAVTLSFRAGTVHVGLHKRARGQMLRLEAGSADGTALGKTRRTHRVGFLLHRTLGFKIGMDFDTMDRITFATVSDPLSNAPTLFSGIISENIDSDYDFENQIAWEQDQPLPGTILAVMPQLVTQDGG